MSLLHSHTRSFSSPVTFSRTYLWSASFACPSVKIPSAPISTAQDLMATHRMKSAGSLEANGLSSPQCPQDSSSLKIYWTQIQRGKAGRYWMYTVRVSSLCEEQTLKEGRKGHEQEMMSRSRNRYPDPEPGHNIGRQRGGSVDTVWPPQPLTSFLPITLKASGFTPQGLQHSYSTLHASLEGFI